MRRPIVVTRLKAVSRAEDRIRTLAAELSSTESVARALQAENVALKDQRANDRRQIAELQGERQQLVLESASHRQRAETMARLEEDSWHLARLRGQQLRQVGLIPLEVES